MTVCFFF